MNLFEEYDQVWAVFDRDEHPRFKDALMRCRQQGVHVAWSNPCFELWLILHEQEYNKPSRSRAVQAALKLLRPEYDMHGAKTPNCDELVRRVEDAERRADTLLQRLETEDRPYGNPSTAVGLLTRAIRNADQEARPRGKQSA